MAHCGSDALVDVSLCGELTVGGHHVPSKATLSLPSPAGQGRENTMESS